MKRKKILLTLSLMILAVFSFYALAQAKTTQNTNENLLIESTINQYFTSKYNSLQ